MAIKKKVAVTANVDGSGNPIWGPDSNATEVPEGQTDVAIENLIAGATYWVKTWNEDQWGNKSTERVQRIFSEAPDRLYPLTFSAQGQFDQGSAMYAYVKIPTASKSIVQVLVTVAFREFQAMAQSADASGSLTSDSGGGSTSGSSSATTSGASNSSTSAGSPHQHVWGLRSNATPGGFTVRRFTDGSSQDFDLATSLAANGNGHFTQLESPSHTHTNAHDHDIPHTHTTPNHTHSVPSHTHALIYGTFEEPYPPSHSVAMRLYHRVSGIWVLQATISGFTLDLQDADLTSYFNAVGDWRISLLSAGGTPQGGRLSADIFGTVTVTL